MSYEGKFSRFLCKMIFVNSGEICSKGVQVIFVMMKKSEKAEYIESRADDEDRLGAVLCVYRECLHDAIFNSTPPVHRSPTLYIYAKLKDTKQFSILLLLLFVVFSICPTLAVVSSLSLRVSLVENGENSAVKF